MPIAIEGPYAAKVMIVGDCPCYEDTKTGRNFSGSSGRMLDTLLTEAGTSRNECLLTTVAKDCPPGGKVAFFYEDAKMLVPSVRMQIYIQKLKEEIQFHRPNIIIALGHVAMNVLTGNTGITKYRGYIEPCTLVPGIKVLTTHHPSSVTNDVKLAFQFILDVRKAIANSVFSGIQETGHDLQIDLTYDQFIDYCDYLIHNHKDKIAIDIETLSPGCHIDVLGIGESATKAVSFPVLLNRTARFSSAQELALWEKVNELVNKKEVIMQNGLFDAAVLLHHTGIWCGGYKYDTLLDAHACWPECPRSLSFLASICLNVPAWKHTANESPLLYNAADAANTWGIWEVLEGQMAILGTRAVHDFEMEQSEVAIMLQLQGVRIDLEKRDKKVAELKESIRLAKIDLETKLGKVVNFASPKQMQELLYKDLMLPIQYERRKHATEERKVTTNEEALVNLSRKSDNPVLNDIIKVKKQMKLLTFMDIEVSPQGRVHTCYNITGATMATETKGLVVDDEEQHKSFARWSSSSSIILEYGSGNFQNIPKDARELYIPPAGHNIVQADYKQAEAVVVAYVIGDNKLKKLFQDSYGVDEETCKANNWDVHKLTASMMFGVPIDLVTPDQRKVGKMIRHACVDSTTEVLTRTGWKPIPEFNRFTEQVAQWDTDGSITFVTPTDAVMYPYTGPMYRFKNLSIDQLVSPAHRMPTFKREGHICTDIFSEHLHPSKNGDITLPLNGRIKQDGYDAITPCFMQLVVAMQADGSIRERGNKREMNFFLKKERKILRLRSLLEANSIEYSESPATDDRIMFYISYSKNQELFDFVKLTNKRFGVWVLGLSLDCMVAAVEESKWWDSRRNGDGSKSWQYYSQHKENCDWLATMAHLAGYKAYVSDHHPSVWTCNLANQQRTYAYRTHRTVEQYTGNIYSMKVPSTYYLIRRNGIISVTGNTNYSAGPGVLATKLNISTNEAKVLLGKFAAGCPMLSLWHGTVREELRRTRMLTNLLGRKHKFLDRWGDSLFRSAYSYIPQSTVGDLLNRALVDYYHKYAHEDEIALQLHDAIYVIVPDDLIERAKERLRECMTIPLTARRETFCIDVDFKVGKSWKDMGEE